MPLEDYESIKEQLNANILEISDKNEHELMADSKREKDIIEFITKDSTFKSVIEEARNKLNLDADDAFPFAFNSSEEVIDTLVYVVAFCRGIAEPYFYKDSYNEDEERVFKTKGEDYGVMFSQLGWGGIAKLEQEITSVINEILTKCGVPESWFTYIGACLLGESYLDFQVRVKSEHSKRLQVVNVERDFVDLRIWKGIKKDEYNDGWKALSDYLTHNVPLGLVRVEDEGTKLYNDKLNGKKTAEIVNEYVAKRPHTSEDDAKRAAYRLLKSRRKYKKIKT